MDNKEKLTWSIEDSESSYQESGSIDAKLESLQISSSLDSYTNTNENVARGKPVLMKSNSENKTKSTSKTSSFVLQVIDTPINSNKSSGYSSSISPSSENHALNSATIYDNRLTFANNPANFNENRVVEILAKKQEVKLNLKKIIAKRIAGKKHNFDQWIFDFGDTNLIKCCRRGQVYDVIEALKDITKHNQFYLINHENGAKETALSIATYQMNEILINLLLEKGARPQQQLSMKNNVLHIAADLENDKERKTFGYLINAIQKYQEVNLLKTLLSKNIFNCEPLQILQIHSEMSCDPICRRNFERQINETQALINNYFRCVPYIPQNY